HRPPPRLRSASRPAATTGERGRRRNVGAISFLRSAGVPPAGAGASRSRPPPPAAAGRRRTSGRGRPRSQKRGRHFALPAHVTTTRIVAICLLLVATQSCVRHDTPTTAVTRQTSARHQEPQPLRVVTVGDSLAYGAGDEEHKGLAGRLRTELQARGVSSAETVNLGVSGAVTGDLLARLRHERTRTALSDADAIVLSIGANDLFRTIA